jgi:hypothetical protein
MMIIDETMERRGWYDGGEGLAMRLLGGGGSWAVRVFDGLVGVDGREVRGLELAVMGLGVIVRVGVASGPMGRPLRVPTWKWVWPRAGSGWILAQLRWDVFGVAIKVWHDGGEASHLS